MKERIIVWGGNGKALAENTLDSHASVNAYFLSKYLRDYYEVCNVTDIDAPEDILRHDNVSHVISTAQFGFTKRVIGKGKLALYREIRNRIPGKLCSIADNNDIRECYEDILFTVRKPGRTDNVTLDPQRGEKKPLRVYRTGWCAEPDFFAPEKKSQNEFNVFVDHACYVHRLNNISMVPFYHKIFAELQTENRRNINVYHQNNDGLIRWRFSLEEAKNAGAIYDRKAKVSYTEIAALFKKIDVFCSTHKESAGLSAIEAAMAGAKLYIPQDIFFQSFIKKDLLDDLPAKQIFYPFAGIFGRLIKKDIEAGIDRAENHSRLSRSEHTWQKAVQQILTALDYHQ
ncbi:MAG: hypothetical protein ACU837_00840 [Gammaproteobacteria bacterium]